MTKEHTDKKVHFVERNDSAAWCHRCHKPGNYLKLERQNGTAISFNEAYLLCGECHGTQYNDWRRNIHGKRVGSWNGPKQVYSCTECHDPHAPAFKPMKPLPMPVPPRGRSKSFLKLLFGDMIHDTGEVHPETQPSR
ncbi:MAG TPA: multiheme c-type cytochrome [bacterium]|nr:multiheme c-type cytochrome [bacterium]